MARQRLPDLLGGEGADRVEEEGEGLGDAVRGRLGRAAGGVVLAEDEEGVLADVAPEGGEVGRGELAEAARDGVELEAVVGLPRVGDEERRAGDEEAVDGLELLRGDGIRRRVEVEEVREEEPRRVADLPVGLGRPREDLLVEADVVGVVGRADPEPEDVGAVLGDDLVGLDGVAHRLRHLPAVARDDEAVRDDGVVGGLAVEGDRREERGLEPAAVLVVPLEVEDVGGLRVGVGGGDAVGRRPEDGGVRDARVEPDVEDVLDLLERDALPLRRRAGRRRRRGSSRRPTRRRRRASRRWRRGGRRRASARPGRRRRGSTRRPRAARRGGGS